MSVATNNTNTSGFKVLQPGILSLIQDSGRFGQHSIGLTTGGPLDKLSFDWANRLCGNTANAATIETSFGGISLEAQVDTQIAVTGGDAQLMINNINVASWRTHAIKSGDKVELKFSQHTTRHYIAVAGGFQITPMFGSAATVAREKLGGLNGTPLKSGDILPCNASQTTQQHMLAKEHQPDYSGDVVLRVVLGYQKDAFSPLQQRRFFNSDFTLSDRCDRMGFRLTGPEIKSDINGILSEGICYGAIQVPSDGQPIILLNDRQTIGGYPKIGSVFSLDIPKLTQRTPETTVRFEALSMDDAQCLLHLAHYRFQQTKITAIS
ncbi:biotin-dependent carboxyltransferase family protein [Leucothrix arctica]|uniref:Allophanate hydrolase n=1 Tax=Leucothrix arctica TaxID=1481894 RepID=A0A317CIQ0_9GAMM|nr:biotin-dependent carboxyltransferase family protein [Leucothrix arctica]PWQ96200.1 allophanate hydrolase [Leucothrix arctica]